MAEREGEWSLAHGGWKNGNDNAQVPVDENKTLVIVETRLFVWERHAPLTAPATQKETSTNRVLTLFSLRRSRQTDKLPPNTRVGTRGVSGSAAGPLGAAIEYPPAPPGVAVAWPPARARRPRLGTSRGVSTRQRPMRPPPRRGRAGLLRGPGRPDNPSAATGARRTRSGFRPDLASASRGTKRADRPPYRSRAAQSRCRPPSRMARPESSARPGESLVLWCMAVAIIVFASAKMRKQLT
jgi:hypothetical protein